MADPGAEAARQGGREPLGLAGERGERERVDGAMDPPQLAGLDPAGDAGVGEASGSELVGGDEIALAGGDWPRGMPRGLDRRKSAQIAQSAR